MAAKPPKPPGNFLKSLLNQHNSNKNQTAQHFQHQNNENDNDDESGGANGSSTQQLITATSFTTKPTGPGADSTDTDTAAIATPKKSNCNCSNISIMHLFHEMKQEFPTIPDTIVAQCVNENCHKRENCIQMLKNELELNPILAQSYPAKVLHPSNNNLQNNATSNTTASAVATTTSASTKTTIASTQRLPPLQQKPCQKPPLKPIRPIRTAPLQPPKQQQRKQQQEENLINNNFAKINSTPTKNTGSVTTNKPLRGEDFADNETVADEGAGRLVESKTSSEYKQSICSTTANTVNLNSATAFEVCNNDDKVCVSGDGESAESNIPRQRPTTLNLNTQLQKREQQQRQRLNIQLQQRFQEQRNRQQQQQQLQPQNYTAKTKPIRKAPLPPIAPKPLQFQSHHTNTIISNDTLFANHTAASPPSESGISLSVSLSTPSPTSSSSPNTTTHHQFNKATRANQHQHLQTKSPIRHRSVITLQPEPPYTRDFLFTPASPTYASSTPSSPSLATTPTAAIKQTTATNSSSSATSSPTTSVAGSQKSFTSVNLTLRPPVSSNDPNSVLQPSTIDITAGPGFSGASGGGKSLHYSSTSYDARLGYQQNFQITVTDECGIFSASRLRPQQHQQHQSCLNQQQFHNNNVVALQQNIQNSIQSPQGANVDGGSCGIYEYISGNMCVSPHQGMDAHTGEILLRQKKKRDKLAAALREYKKRLGNVEQEINLLTGTIPTKGLSQRLDEEINKLRRDCEVMIRSSNTFPQPPPQQELAIDHLPQQQPMYPPQPFPRQKLVRPPPRPPPPRQTSLDIIQHHSQTPTPHTPPAASLPNLTTAFNSPLQNQPNVSLTSPPYFHTQSETMNPNTSFSNNNVLYTDNHSNYMEDRVVVEDDDGGGGDYDEYEEVNEPWECTMCTFRNHPQLNICETCDNVRIIPGRLTNFSGAFTPATKSYNEVQTASSPSSHFLTVASDNAINNSSSTNISNSNRNEMNAANGNLEHDTNLVQQQLEHFALHT